MLLEQKKAACVSIIDGMNSTYWWKGAVENATGGKVPATPAAGLDRPEPGKAADAVSPHVIAARARDHMAERARAGETISAAAAGRNAAPICARLGAGWARAGQVVATAAARAKPEPEHGHHDPRLP